MFAIPRLYAVRFVALIAIIALTGVALMGSPSRGSAGSPAAAAPAAFSADDAIDQITRSDGTLRFDVAENGTIFAWSGDPELKDGLPVQRTAFVSQGYIYPAGTLTEGNGVLADGSPEFPDKVLGQWSCWGWNVSADAAAGEATWIVSHLLNFGAEPGEATLVSEGYSIDTLDVVLERAVTGGTGPYMGATGIQTETNLGYNASEGMNFHYEIHLAGE
jgi:hypothetical protein